MYKYKVCNMVTIINCLDKLTNIAREMLINLKIKQKRIHYITLTAITLEISFILVAKFLRNYPDYMTYLYKIYVLFIAINN